MPSRGLPCHSWGRSTAGRWLTAGAHSGRTEEKIARAGLTVEYTPAGTPCIGGAEIVLECRKMYRDRFGPAEFLEKELIDAWYPEKDFHYLYICAIEKVYVRE